MSDFAEVIEIFRCTRCGKWSHAQRRPSSHERIITDGGPAEHNGYEHTPARRVALASGYSADDIVDEEEGFWADAVRTNAHGDPEPDEVWHSGRVVLRCGPFEPWTARPGSPATHDQPPTAGEPRKAEKP